MLAAELALAGIDVLVVERRTNQELDGRRAGGLHSRTLEVLDQRGVADRFVSAGQTHPRVGYAGTSWTSATSGLCHNYVLALWQKDIEVILAGWVDELGVSMLRGTRCWASHRMRPASMSNCPAGRPFRPATWSGATGAAA